jgi:hypothetical protein
MNKFRIMLRKRPKLPTEGSKSVSSWKDLVDSISSGGLQNLRNIRHEDSGNGKQLTRDELVKLVADIAKLPN